VAGKVNPIKIAGENGAGGKSKSKQEQR